MAGAGAGIVPYNPTLDGEILRDVQRIESIGEAYHDFIMDTSRSSHTIRLKMKDFFQRTEGRTSGISEIETSQLIHEGFNGGGRLRADLRLTACKRDKPYDDPRVLADALFFLDGHAGSEILTRDDLLFQVNPLVFMIPANLLDRGDFDTLLEKLAGILRMKYNLSRISAERDGAGAGAGAAARATITRLGVTHDSYKEDNKIGNVFDAHIILSPATLYDPATTGSGRDDVTSAMRDGRFTKNVSLDGTSYWGTWRLQPNLIGDHYNGATIRLDINGNVITLTFPRIFYRGPSPANLSMIYDTIMTHIVAARIQMNETQKNHLLGEIFSKNPTKGAFDRDFYLGIINNCIQLYGTDPDLVLKFIFFLKELGDMMQHKMAVVSRHLALGSVDGLSTIAFLKRGGPVCYMLKNDNKGLPNLLFRVAGTFHKTDEMTPAEIAEQDRAVEEASRRAAAAKEELTRQKQALFRQNRRTQAAAAAEAYKKPYKKRDRSSLEESRHAALVSAASHGPFLNAANNGRSSKSPKFTRGGKLNKTRKRKYNISKKQRGGAIDKTIVLLINALFLNLYYVLDNNSEDTLLFTDLHPYTDESINDYTLIGLFSDKDNEVILFDNKLLGLPLCSVLYMLSDVIEETPIKDKEEIIKQFLEVYGFTENDVNRILGYMNPVNLNDEEFNTILETARDIVKSKINTVSMASRVLTLPPLPASPLPTPRPASPPPTVPREELSIEDNMNHTEISPIILGPALNTTSEVNLLIRNLTQYDKNYFRILVDKGYSIRGIIPTVYYERRANNGAKFEEPETYTEIDELKTEVAAFDAGNNDGYRTPPVEMTSSLALSLESTPTRPTPLNPLMPTPMGAQAVNPAQGLTATATPGSLGLGLGVRRDAPPSPESGPPSRGGYLSRTKRRRRRKITMRRKTLKRKYRK